MPAPRYSLWVFALCLGISACGDESKADPSAVFGGQSGSSSNTSATTFCIEYCRSLVENGEGCERYNDDQRCENICRFYVNSACKTTYMAFADCMRTTQSGSCMAPDGGTLTLVVDGCNEEYEAWIQCRDERDAGVCPY